MTSSRLLASALLASLSALALPAVSYAQAPGIHRTDLQGEDLSVPGREAVQVLVAFEPGVVAGNHHHNGEEIVYVIDNGGTIREPDGTLVTLEAGAALICARGVPHAGFTNVGDRPLKMLNVFVVDKGKPLTELV